MIWCVCRNASNHRPDSFDEGAFKQALESGSKEHAWHEVAGENEFFENFLLFSVGEVSGGFAFKSSVPSAKKMTRLPLCPTNEPPEVRELGTN